MVIIGSTRKAVAVTDQFKFEVIILDTTGYLAPPNTGDGLSVCMKKTYSDEREYEARCFHCIK